MASISVTDPADSRLDDYRDLTNADRRPDRPGGRGLVIAEGVPVVERLIASPYPVRSVMGVAAKTAHLEPVLRAAALDVPVYTVPVDVMDSVVGFHLNRGVLACADRAAMPSFADLMSMSTRLLVLEGVGDHENLGSLFRNAAAFGVDAVVLGPRCSDPLYRRAVRVSMGNVLRVPFCTVDAGDWPDALFELRAGGFEVLATTPAPPAVRLSALDPAMPKVAVMVGSEGPGLTPVALGAASRAVRIPMADGVDSLNVATAAAVVLAHFAKVD
ncbi:TrmH family RNA methyltransferase [Cumulibacter soli]|uniref:TrmH family RNA methyltransferase n=1 Tax=Cumulibacter soli TaxID=2546344 RepID=UPI001ABAC310|nr:RNA methyltransferase [Cumulibacter soli]